MNTRIFLIATTLLLALWCTRSALAAAAGAQPQVPPALQNVGFDQHLNEQVPLDLQFKDENANDVQLGDYFGQKPVILVLAYYRCPMLCTLVLNGVVSAMREMPFTLGKEYNVVTVSFDPRETPDLAAVKRKNYLASYGVPGTGEGWHFLTGKPEAIRKLTSAVGFRYLYDARQDQYIHTSGILILTPQGKISRYFYGIQFPARDVRLALVEASAGKIGSPTDQILLYCFHFDPQTGKYSANILSLVRMLGVASLAATVGLVWVLWWRGKRRSSPPKQAALADGEGRLPSQPGGVT